MNSGSDSDSNSAASGYDDDGDNDDNDNDQLTDNVAAMEQAVLPPMSEYELLRHNNILLNNAKLKELNFEPYNREAQTNTKRKKNS